MKLLSWNVNGIRALAGRDGLAAVQDLGADVICLQEIKATAEQAGDILPAYPHQVWNPAERKGYSGTAVFSRIEPLQVRLGIGMPEHDDEGRVTSLELADFWVVTVYTPNAGRGLDRLEYRMAWDRAFLQYVRGLERRKPVIFCGDLNVAHQEIDLANPRTNRRNAGFTDEEREGFTQLQAAGYLDTFRELCDAPGHYTWWAYWANARERNIGWRIDYVCLSRSLRPLLREAFILSEIQGSDHCPVGVVLEEAGA